MVRRLIVFATGSVLAVLVLLALVAWLFDAFGAAGMSGHGMVAMVIGVVMTTIVGVGLMSLVFYSARFHGEERPDASSVVGREEPRSGQRR
jgi:hypothetical protein